MRTFVRIVAQGVAAATLCGAMAVAAAASYGALGEATVPHDLAAAVVYEPLLPDLAREKLAYTHLLMSAYEQHSGHLPEAREELDKAIGALESPAMYARSGELALSMQDPARAEKDSEKALELDPKHADAHLTLGKREYTRGRSNRSNRQLRKAARHFRDAIEADPKHINAYYYLGNLSREIRDFRGAIEAYGALVSLRPLDPSNRLRLGQAYQLNGEVARAIEEYERATQIDANYVQARQSLANLHEQLGAREKAAHEYEVLVKLRPTPAFLGELGRLYVELEQFDEAIDAYGRMLEASDDDEDSIRILLARLHANADRYDEAIAECHKVITTSKDSSAKVEAYSILGSLYLVREQHEDALQALTAALAIHDDHRDALYWLAMTYDQMGDPSLAANTLNRILTMDPSDHRAQNTLGYLYAETGERLDEAGELVMSALEAEPSNPAYLDSLGWIRFKQGRYSDAITFLQRAATHDPANVEILDHLGDAYVEAGHQDKAVASWRQALELEPENDGIQQKVRDLSSAGAGVE